MTPRCGARLVEPRGGEHRQEFAAAWANGRAFLAADRAAGPAAGLVEWKGPTQAPGDEVVPADLRVDHVWLVSCKYLSKVLANAAPSRLFERGLAGGPAARATGDWYADVAPDAYQALFTLVRRELGTARVVPAPCGRPDARPSGRSSAYLDAGWSPDARSRAYRELALEVGKVSADRWRRTAGQAHGGGGRAVAPAPHRQRAVLRARCAAHRSLRLRVMTPWDWRQAYELKRMDVWGDDAGQPQVR